MGNDWNGRNKENACNGENKEMNWMETSNIHNRWML